MSGLEALNAMLLVTVVNVFLYQATDLIRLV